MDVTQTQLLGWFQTGAACFGLMFAVNIGLIILVALWRMVFE